MRFEVQKAPLSRRSFGHVVDRGQEFAQVLTIRRLQVDAAGCCASCEELRFS